MYYRYCAWCSKKVIKKSNSHGICVSCGRHWYTNPAPANALILENERGEILLAKRLFPPKKGYWDVPGGFAEISETMEESLVREIKEELGISISDYIYFGSYPDTYTYKGLTIPTLNFIYTARVSSDTHLTASDDISEVQYFPKSKIPFTKLAFPYLQRVLKDYLKKG